MENVWVQICGPPEGKPFAFRIVRSPEQATPMTQDNAYAMMLQAQGEYPDYVWEMGSWFKGGEFVVHGRKK